VTSGKVEVLRAGAVDVSAYLGRQKFSDGA
jgi:hypothetical protein